MTDDERIWIEAEFTKINFLMENVWALVTANHGATPAAIDDLAQEMRRQFLTMPGTTSNGMPAPANDDLLTERAAERMATFFSGLRRRIASAQDHPDR